MTEHRKVTCDSCEKDLTTTNNCMDYYLNLHVHSKTRVGAVATLMNLSPPIDSPKDFCGLGCLKRWIMENVRLPEEVK